MGEKLHEEVLNENKTYIKQSHKKIYIVKSKTINIIKDEKGMNLITGDKEIILDFVGI